MKIIDSDCHIFLTALARTHFRNSCAIFSLCFRSAALRFASCSTIFMKSCVSGANWLCGEWGVEGGLDDGLLLMLCDRSWSSRGSCRCWLSPTSARFCRFPETWFETQFSIFIYFYGDFQIKRNIVTISEFTHLFASSIPSRFAFVSSAVISVRICITSSTLFSKASNSSSCVAFIAPPKTRTFNWIERE